MTSVSYKTGCECLPCSEAFYSESEFTHVREVSKEVKNLEPVTAKVAGKEYTWDDHECIWYDEYGFEPSSNELPSGEPQFLSPRFAHHVSDANFYLRNKVASIGVAVFFGVVATALMFMHQWSHGLISVFFSGWFVMSYFHEKSFRTTVDSVDSLWTVETPAVVNSQVQDIMDVLDALPEYQRAEFLPLVGVVREACLVLVDDPDDYAMLDVVGSRRDVLVRLGDTLKAVEAAVAVIPESDVEGSVGGVDGSVFDGSDLVAAGEVLAAAETGLQAVLAANPKVLPAS